MDADRIEYVDKLGVDGNPGAADENLPGKAALGQAGSWASTYLAAQRG